jgi:hypothetical protein
MKMMKTTAAFWVGNAKTFGVLILFFFAIAHALSLWLVPLC